MAYKTVEVDVDIDLEEFDDDELIDELERRGLDMNTRYISGDQMRELLEKVWQKRREGKEYQRELDDMIWYGLGRVV